jgi:hypothetical protein
MPSKPIRIKRLALQLEMDDGRLMTFYADERHAAGAEVTLTTETVDTGGYWPPLARPVPHTLTAISIERLNGYVMTIREPAAAPRWIHEARKGIER